MLDTLAPARPRLVVTVLATSGISVAMTQTVVVPLVPVLPAVLGTSADNVAWLVIATLLAGAVLCPALGRLGDMYGKRRVLLAALAVMTAGSLLCAVAPNVDVLIAGRTLQGAALGVVPLGISIMRDTLAPTRVGAGVGLMSSTLGIGGAVGLPLSGLVAEQWSWRWLFAVVALLGAVQLVAVVCLVPESRLRSGGRFDLIGAVGLAAGLVCLLLAISRGGRWGWTSPITLGLVAAAVVVLAGWGRYQLKAGTPLVNLRTSARPAVLRTNLASILVGYAMFTPFLAVPQVLQASISSGYGFGISMTVCGVLMLPVGVAMLVFSPLSARLSRWRGPRTTLVAGALLLLAGNAAWPLTGSDVRLVVLGVTVGSVGTALAFSALPTLIMRAVPAGETAAANSLNTLMRALGTSSCGAVVAALTTVMVQPAGAGGVQPSPAAYDAVFLAGALSAAAAALLAAVTRPVLKESHPADLASTETA